MKTYGQGDRLYVQAQQIWLILGAVATLNLHKSAYGNGHGAGLICYGELAELMGKPAQAAVTLGRQLYIVGKYCAKFDLPSLNAIVINRDTGTPGEGVILTKGISDYRDEQDNVRAFDWFSVRPPTISKLKKIYYEE